ncbi:hypothetical protein BV22DRAFT_279210 [Leucogyrophana mollusca]|uniref:Uncharacterized protein n=1 Tax=Leucogyrophana mollusca TaxID=85980 RepID=A0ACB8BQP6_9AGAM|nr:hypothetical protein BV22DRAFT_279210 [Leucogyrophana mollusca]
MDDRLLPWKSWSASFNYQPAQKKICSLLNKLNTSNFDSVASQITHWTTSCGRCGDAAALHAIACTVVRRALTDDVRSLLYARLCRKIDDELDKEDEDWIWCNHTPTPSHIPSFARILHGICVRHAIHNDDIRLSQQFLFEPFIGDLLLHGVLSPSDVQELVNDLLAVAERGEEQGAIALSRMLRRIVQRDEAWCLFEQLGVLEGIERVLEEDRLTQRARYLLMVGFPDAFVTHV